jgi:hypothetical protein
MKKFLLQILWFSLLVPIFTYITPLYSITTEKYKKTGPGKEVYYSIYKSKQKTKSRKLLLGDSVAQQIFSNKQYNDTLNSLTCNMAIGMIGQFLLLNNYINTGNRPDTVYMFFTPSTTAGSSFNNNLNQIYTFHYFLKPFYTKEYKPFFTETTYQQIKKIPVYFLCQEPHILTSGWAPEFSQEEKQKSDFLSPISIEYLKKIKLLSLSYHFRLIFVPTPVSISSRKLIQNMKTNGLSLTGLESELNDYLNKIEYYNDTLFVDGIHLKKPNLYVTYYKQKYIK